VQDLRLKVGPSVSEGVAELSPSRPENPGLLYLYMVTDILGKFWTNISKY